MYSLIKTLNLMSQMHPNPWCPRRTSDSTSHPLSGDIGDVGLSQKGSLGST